jgi:CheY-like chemotaxis protein
MESTYRPILHVEDDENDAFLMNRAMGIAEIVHPVQVVKNGVRAVNYLLGLPPFANRHYYPLPSLILLDWSIPQLNGLELLKWRQSQPTIKLIPVIVLTSSQQATDVATAYDAGANGYLTKPVTFDGLVEMAKAIRIYWLTHNHYAALPDESDDWCVQPLPATGRWAKPAGGGFEAPVFAR